MSDMREYLRIMFGKWNIMDDKDWNKWQNYSSKTFLLVVSMWGIVFLIVFGLKLTL